MEYKQAILVRTDLNMSRGKLSAQVGHAAVEAALTSNSRKVSEWRRQGMKKVVLKVNSLRELNTLEKRAKKAGLTTALITDAGHTELKPGTVTCLGLGPDLEEKINKISGQLKAL